MRRLLLIVFAIAISRCVSSSRMSFGVVAVDALPASFVVLAKGVKGEDCPKGVGKYGSYELAMQRAVALAPTANALANAKFSRVERPLGTMCVTVTGDAIRI
jgi:hypothetical protein